MRTYVAKRLLLIVPTLLGVAALVFFIMRVIPGDVTLLILGGDQAGRIDPAQIAAMKHQLGLDQPLLVQFGTWLWGVLRFDFGTSLWTGQSVIDELLIRLPLSLELALLASMALSETLLSTAPLYDHYAGVADRPFGLTWASDQRVAALLMTAEQLATLGAAVGILLRSHVYRLEAEAGHPL